MIICKVRVDRGSPKSGYFDWALVDGQGALLDTGAGPARLPSAHDDCELVIASDLVMLDRIQVPHAQQRRISSALRFAVEDSAIPDPERLHVASAPAEGEDVLAIGVVDREWLAQVLAQLKRSGLVPNRAYPECLTPALSPGTWVVVCRSGHDSFARTGSTTGFVLDSAMPGEVPVALRLALNESRLARAAPGRLVVSCAPGTPQPDLRPWTEALGVVAEPGPAWQWAVAGRSPEINLLSGEFSPSGVKRDWLRSLRRSALLAGAVLGVTLGGMLADLAAKTNERRKLAEEMSAIYRSTFGEKAVIVDAPLQMSRGLAQARRQAGQIGGDDLLALFGTAADRLLDPGQHRIDNLSYGNGVLELGVRATDRAQFKPVLGEFRSKLPVAGLDVKLTADEPAGRILLRVNLAAEAAR